VSDTARVGLEGDRRLRGERDAQLGQLLDDPLQATVGQPALALRVAASHVGVRAREQHLGDAIVRVPEGSA
jgi:hypothetical protein